MSNELTFDKYDYFTLDIINSFLDGKGIGWPALDRNFYTRVARDEGSSDERIYKIRLQQVIEKLRQNELIEDSESKKGIVLSTKGKILLEELKNKLKL